MSLNIFGWTIFRFRGTSSSGTPRFTRNREKNNSMNVGKY